MRARQAAVDSTRERILRAFYEIWLERPYDQMTMDEVAAAAGVARQTVIRQFGTKDELAVAVVDWLRPVEEASRESEPGDVDGAIHRLVGRYEELGDANIRLLELEGRLPEVDYALQQARASHRAWIVDTFTPPDDEHVVMALYAATDVTLWKLLRRDFSRSRAATESIMRMLVGGVLDRPAASEPASPTSSNTSKKKVQPR